MRTHASIALPSLGSALLIATLAACGAGSTPGDLAAVRVQVVDTRTGEPRAGARVRMFPLVEGAARTYTPFELRSWTRSSGVLPLQLFARTLDARTDLDGACEFRLPNSWSFLAIVEDVPSRAELTDYASMRLLRPAAGTLPDEVEIGVPPPWGQPLPEEGFVRSAVDGAPIDGARISHVIFGYPERGPDEDRPSEWVSNPDGSETPVYRERRGHAEVVMPDLGEVVRSRAGVFPIGEDVAEGSYALLEAPGHAPRYVEYRMGDPSAPGIEDVALQPGATLEVFLLDGQPDSPRELEVFVSARLLDLGYWLAAPHQEQRFEPAAVGDGLVRFEDLPVDVPLSVHVVADAARALPAVAVAAIAPGASVAIEVGVPATYSHVAWLELNEVPDPPRDYWPEGWLMTDFRAPPWLPSWEEDPEGDERLMTLAGRVYVYGPAPRAAEGGPDYAGIEGPHRCWLNPDAERRYFFAGLPQGDYLLSTGSTLDGPREVYLGSSYWTLRVGPGEQPPEGLRRRHGAELGIPHERRGDWILGVVADGDSGYPRSAVVELWDGNGELVDVSLVRGSNGSLVNNMQRTYLFGFHRPVLGDLELRARSPGGLRGEGRLLNEVGDREVLHLTVQ